MTDPKASAQQIVIATEEALRLMSALPEWTAKEIYGPAGAAIGEPRYGLAYRVVDRLIQKERRAGRIEQVRHAVWRRKSA